MAANLFITNKRMLALMEWAVANGIADSEKEYMRLIGFTTTNIAKVRNGSQSFTKEHILEACKLTGASADFIFGFTSEIRRREGKGALELLREAVVAVEHELRPVNTPVNKRNKQRKKSSS